MKPFLFRSIPKKPLSFYKATNPARLFSTTKPSLGPKEFKIVSSDSDSITLTGLIDNKPSSDKAQINTRFLNLFLRDADPTPGAVDPSTCQKNFSTGEISVSSLSIKSSKIIPSLNSSSSSLSSSLQAKPLTTATCTNPEDPALEITWSDGLVSLYPFAFLSRNATSSVANKFRYVDQPKILWSQLPQYPSNSEQAIIAEKENRGRLDVSVIPKVDYNEYMKSEKEVYKVCKALHDYGLVFVVNMPDQDGIVYSNEDSSSPMSPMSSMSSPMSSSSPSSFAKPSISPSTTPLVERIAKRIGYIKQTFYGPSWQVISVPSPKNAAYTSSYLPLHMDLCYYESPPGVQLLHVIDNSTIGGENLFADSFAAVEHIAEKDPEAYEALKTVPITFHYDNDGQHYWYERPLIVEEEGNASGEIDPKTGERKRNVKVVNYSPPFQGPLAGAMLRGSYVEGSPNNDVNPGEDLAGSKFTDSQIKAFHRGYNLFENYVSDKSNQMEIKMQENTCVLFMNRRTLHARNEFRQSEDGEQNEGGIVGKRWFQGTYLDLDAWQSKLRMGVRQFGNESV